MTVRKEVVKYGNEVVEYGFITPLYFYRRLSVLCDGRKQVFCPLIVLCENLNPRIAGKSRRVFYTYLCRQRSDWSEYYSTKIFFVLKNMNRGIFLTQACLIIFFNGPTPASFSFIFGLFKPTIQFFTTNQCEKCRVHPVYGAGIRTHCLRFSTKIYFKDQLKGRLAEAHDIGSRMWSSGQRP